MESTAYDKTDELENRYWWYIGRRYVFDKLLDRLYSRQPTSLVVDIGCGTGGNIPMLSRHGEVLGLDISEKALEFCRNKGFANVRLMPEVPGTGLETNSVDLITMFDVLEHIQDDEAALREYYRILKSGGMILLSLPAFKFLWSELDTHLHHFRRYTKLEIEKKLKNVGFEIAKSSYLFFFTFVPVFLYRTVGHFQEKQFHPQFRYTEFAKIFTWMLISLSKLESFLLRFINLPVGSTIVCIARKK